MSCAPPLTSISGFAELIWEGIAQEERIKEFAGDIYRESQRLIALVDDIIKVSRLDEKGSIPAPEQISLRGLCEKIEKPLAPAALKRNISFTIQGEDVPLNVVVQILDEMIFNLCDNAIKYNRPGGSVTVSLAHTDSEAIVTVQDTGIGIPYAHQSRAFERFYRVDKSHSKEIGGTGLGLSIVKHGAQYLGAKLDLTSKPGEGTTIRLALPLDPGHQAQEPPAIAEDRAQTEDRAQDQQSGSSGSV